MSRCETGFTFAHEANVNWNRSIECPCVAACLSSRIAQRRAWALADRILRNITLSSSPIPPTRPPLHSTRLTNSRRPIEKTHRPWSHAATMAIVTTATLPHSVATLAQHPHARHESISSKIHGLCFCCSWPKGAVKGHALESSKVYWLPHRYCHTAILHRPLWPLPLRLGLSGHCLEELVKLCVAID